MCIIAIKPKGREMFDKATIKTMFDNNSDGAGFMYFDRKSKKVIIQKGFMTYDDLIKELFKPNRNFKNTNLILHFRIGTSGKMDKLNCHPYPIYDDNVTYCKTDIALAHNGILYDYTPSKNSKINDTQVFIKNVLKPLKKGFQDNRNITTLIGEIIGTNKFAILDDTNKITLIGDFIKDNGYVYSNTTYKPRVYTNITRWKTDTHNSVNTTATASYGGSSKTHNSEFKANYVSDDDDNKTHNSANRYDSFWDDDYQDHWFWKDFDEKYIY